MNRGAHVVAAQSVVGGRLVGSHAFFGETAAEAHARFAAYEKRKRAISALGQPPAGPLVWQNVAPDSSGDYAFANGQRYAVLASVSRDYTAEQVGSYLAKHGWTVTYSWEQGESSRGQYAIDDWLGSLSPDTTSNHRWLYAEANRTGPDASLGQSAPWPFTFYAIADVFQAVPGPPSTAPTVPTLPRAPTSAPSSSSASPIVYVGGGFAAGLVAWGLWVLVRRLL